MATMRSSQTIDHHLRKQCPFFAKVFPIFFLPIDSKEKLIFILHISIFNQMIT